jgi:predicted NBD/HSP70 family sugar kinase
VKATDADGSGVRGDLAGLREQNLRRILGALLGSRQGLSQPRLVELTGLSRSTVSSLLTHHLGGVLRSDARRNGENSGRPIKAWSINPSACFSIGADIGEKHVSAVLVDLLGNRLTEPIQESMSNTLDDPHRTLALATDLVTKLVDSGGVACEKVAAVTVGMPGPVDLESGEMVDAAAPAWVGMDVREEIRKRWPAGRSAPRRLVDNRANLGALAEYRVGAGQGAESLAFLDWSARIGAGLRLEGRSWRGHSGVAGQIGHLTVPINPREAALLGLPEDRALWKACESCGQVDCLDGLAGGATVAAALGLASLSEVADVALVDPTSLESAQAREILGVAAALIGRAIGPVVTLLNLDRVIIGGGVEPLLYPLLVKDLSRGIEETAFSRASSDVSLEIGLLGPEASVTGAATLGIDEFGIDFLIREAQGASNRHDSEPIFTSS